MHPSLAATVLPRIGLVDATPSASERSLLLSGRLSGCVLYTSLSAALADPALPVTAPIMVVWDGLLEADRDRLSSGSPAAFRRRVGLLGSSIEPKFLVSVLRSHTPCEVSCAPVSPDAIAEVASRLLERSVPNLAKAFSPTASRKVLTLSKSLEIDPAIGLASAFVDAAGASSWARDAVRAILDELLSNALYHAPRDPHGRARFGAGARRTAVSLAAGESVRAEIACEAGHLGVFVSDPFGALVPERVLDYVARSMKRGPDQVADHPLGAGLGFYQVWHSSNAIRVAIEPGRRTEVGAILPLGGSRQDFLAAGKSLSIATGETAWR